MKELLVLSAVALFWVTVGNADEVKKITLMTMPTTEAPEYTRSNIIELKEAMIVDVKEEKYQSVVTFTLKGIYEGNMCGAKDMVLEYKYVDSKFEPAKEIRRAKLNLIYLSQGETLNIGSNICAQT